MDIQKPLFETNYVGFPIKVYPNRVDLKTKVFGTESIPINQIASIQTGMKWVLEIVIETAGGKKYKIPCIKKNEVRDAIYKAQANFNNTSNTNNNNSSIADELTKLAGLKNQGLLSEKEFEEQKKKLLS
jgi:hypothetical protein